MRAISTPLEMVLVLFILMSLLVALWLFTSGTIKALTQAGTNRTERTREILSTCMSVDSVFENKVYIKNCGDGILTNSTLKVYLDELSIQFNMTPETVRKGEIGTINANLFGLSLGEHELKISNPSLQIIQRVENALLDSCVVALDFDEGTGTIAYDKSAYSNNCVLNRHTVWSTGKYGYGLKFDGIDDDATCTNDASVKNIENAIALETWVKFDSMPIASGQARFLAKYQSWYMGVGDDGSVYVSLFWAVSVPNPYCWSAALPGTVQAGKWYHILEVYDKDANNQEPKIYINGTEVVYDYQQACGAPTYQLNISDNYFSLGSSNPNNWAYLNGTLDNVRIYNKALTPEQTVNLKMK